MLQQENIKHYQQVLTLAMESMEKLEGLRTPVVSEQMNDNSNVVFKEQHCK